jgi:phosphofructokinase-like protein
MKKKLLILTGGGDCPGLNAVIRAVVKSAQYDGNWEVYGSIEAFNGILREPMEVVKLTRDQVAGIHFRGGTIIGTTNKGDPFHFPLEQEDGSIKEVDRSDEVIEKAREMGFEAVISVGGDGSQAISQAFFEKGMNVVGVPKTIDNDLSATDMTFGFQTAVEIATEAVDKLVTTAASHNRVMILEVMGRSAGWIALYSAMAGGAEVCLIPEIPYDINKVVERIERRYKKGRGFANIVIAEGAKPIGGEIVARKSSEKGYKNVRLGGVGYNLAEQLKEANCPGDIRVNVLGHVQRGGVPIAFDRVLATQFGVRAFELVRDRQYGRMVALRGGKISDVTLKEATAAYNFVKPDDFRVRAARAIGISFGD